MGAHRSFAVAPMLLCLAGLGLGGCQPSAPDPPANGVAITAPVKLIGGDCVGPARLGPGWRLWAQKLDIDDDGSTVALVLLQAPAPARRPLSKPPTAGLISVQARDLYHYPNFAGRRSYEDVIRDTARARGPAASERYGALMLTRYPAPGGDQYFIADDPAQSLLTCTPPSGDSPGQCAVTTTRADGRYKLTTTFAYAARGEFKAMVDQAQSRLAEAIVPCS